jgi:hypothetical protein
MTKQVLSESGAMYNEWSNASSCISFDYKRLSSE